MDSPPENLPPDRAVAELIKLLGAHQFAALIGDRGAGKTRLLLSGLAPALSATNRLGMAGRWRRLYVTPGNEPIRRLAEAVTRVDPASEASDVRAALLADPQALGRLAEGLALAPDQHVLIVVDRFEELVQLHRKGDQSQSEHFVELLLNMVRAATPRAHLVLAMSPETLADCHVFPGLGEAIDYSQARLVSPASLVSPVANPPAIPASPPLPQKTRISMHPFIIVGGAALLVFGVVVAFTVINLVTISMNRDRPNGVAPPPQNQVAAHREISPGPDPTEERAKEGLRWYLVAGNYRRESNHLSTAIAAGQAIGFAGDRRRPAEATPFYTPDDRGFRELKAWANPTDVCSHPIWSRVEAEPALRQASFSPDGRLIALAREGGGIELIDLGTGKVRSTLAGGQDWRNVRCFDFSPDGELIAAGGAGGKIGLWRMADLPEAAERLSLPPFQVFEGGAEVGCLAFSPNSTVLAAGGDDEIKIWSVASGTVSGTLKEAGARTLAFSTDGLQLAAGFSGGRILMWTLAAGASPRLFSLGNGDVTALALGPEGALVASTRTGQMQIWDVLSGGFRALRLPPTPVLCWAFSPDGRTLAGGCQSGTIHFWDVKSGKFKAHLRTHQNAVESVAFAPDGFTLASMTSRVVTLWDARSDADKTFGNANASFPVEFDLTTGTMAESTLLWDLRSGTPLAKLANRSGIIRDLVYIPTRGELLTMEGEQVLAWNAYEGARKYILSRDFVLSCLAADTKGKTVAIGSNSGELWLVDLPTRRARNKIQLVRSAGIHQLALSSDGATLASYAYSYGVLKLWKLDPAGRTLTQLAEVKEAGRISVLEFSPNGSLLAVGRDGPREVILVDATNGQVRHEWDILGEVHCLDFSADGTMLAAGGQELKIYNTKTGAELNKLGITHQRWVGYRGVAFHPDGQRLYSFTSDRRFRHWDLGDYEQDRRFSAAAYLEAGYCRLTTNSVVWVFPTNRPMPFVNVRPSSLVGTLQSAPPKTVEQTLCRTYLRAGDVNGALLMYERIKDPEAKEAARRDLFVRLAYLAYSAYFRGPDKPPLRSLANFRLRQLQPLLVPQEKDASARAMKRLLWNVQSALQKPAQQ